MFDARPLKTDCRNISRDKVNRPSHLSQTAYRSYILGTIISKQKERKKEIEISQKISGPCERFVRIFCRCLNGCQAIRASEIVISVSFGQTFVSGSRYHTLPQVQNYSGVLYRLSVSGASATDPFIGITEPILLSSLRDFVGGVRLTLISDLQR
jgi:hypothetical protein